MRILAILGAALILSACATVGRQPVTPAHEVEIFLEACEAVGVDCRDVPAPVVVVSKLVDHLTWPGRAYGITMNGEPVIIINPNLNLSQSHTNPDYAEVVFHETVHYILDVLGITRDRCTSERTARELTDKRMGREYDDNWELQYGCRSVD